MREKPNGILKRFKDKKERKKKILHEQRSKMNSGLETTPEEYGAL